MSESNISELVLYWLRKRLMESRTKCRLSIFEKNNLHSKCLFAKCSWLSV